LCYILNVKIIVNNELLIQGGNMKAGIIILSVVCTLMTATPLQAAEKLVIASIEDTVHALISEKVVTDAYQRIGIEAVVRYYPGNRSVDTSNRGDADGELYRVAGMNKDYPNLLMVPVPIGKFDGMVFTKETEFDVNGWESLKPYKVGVRGGIRFSDEGTGSVEGIYLETVSSNEQLFLMCESGRVDIIVIARLNGLKMQQKLKKPGIRPLEPPIQRYLLYHYLHKKNSHLIPKISAALQEMEKEGLIKRIRDQIITEMFGFSE